MARVRLPGGLLSARGLRELADAAATLGSGVIELTSRANVQVRGLDDPAQAGFAARMAAAGLLPSATHERVRNILASPMSGLDGHGLLDVMPLVRELDEALRACPALAGLSGRFLFALDDGRGDMLRLAPDVTFLPLRAARSTPPHRDTHEAALLLAGTDTGLRLSLPDAVPAMVTVAELFLVERATQGSTAWRLAELNDGPTRITHRLTSLVHPKTDEPSPQETDQPPTLPAFAAPPAIPALAPTSTLYTPTSSPALPALAPTSALPTPTSPPALPPLAPTSALPTPTSSLAIPTPTSPSALPPLAAPPALPPLGAFPSLPGLGAFSCRRRGGEEWYGEDGAAVRRAGRPSSEEKTPVGWPPEKYAIVVMAPLGRLTAGQAQALAAAAEAGDGEIRLTPSRTLIVPGIDGDAVTPWLTRLGAAGLVGDPESEWNGVTACTGRPGCAKSLSDVRADAASATARMEAARPAVRDAEPRGRLPVHWAGCERRCGRPGGTVVTVIATGNGGYRIDLDGWTGRFPAAPGHGLHHGDMEATAALVAEARRAATT
nr:hypothetical protein [Sphaerisporangium fuscum]